MFLSQRRIDSDIAVVVMSLLVALGRRLDHATGVETGADTGERVSLLLEEQLVGSLLPLAGHGVRRGLSEETGHGEEAEADTKADGDTPGNLCVGAGRLLGTGAVRAKGNPVSSLLLLDSELAPAALHAVTQGHPEVGLLLEGHALPSLLDVGEGRLGNGVGGGSSGRSSRAADEVLAQQAGRLGAHHFDRWTTQNSIGGWSGCN
jgi:hypothetical protein